MIYYSNEIFKYKNYNKINNYQLIKQNNISSIRI